MRQHFKYVLSLLSALLCFQVMMAQNAPAEDQNLILNPGELLEQELLDENNQVYINQIGTSNQVEIAQNLGANGLGNIAKLLQSGDYNAIVITQTGGNNQLALIQKGNENLFDLEQIGKNNEIGVIQNGDNNTVIQKLIDSDDLRIEILQDGNDNEVIQEIEGLSNREFKIYQIGDGMKVIVRQSGDL